MSKKLGRTPEAVREKALRMGLGAFTENGDYITLNQLFIALGIDSSGTYKLKMFMENGLPWFYKKHTVYKYRCIKLKTFWNWLEQHKDLISFKNFDHLALGEEPPWVAVKRRTDIAKAREFKTTPWTKSEDDLLVRLLNEYKYGYKDISLKLRRTEGAIKRRCYDLKIKARPVKANNHNPWSAEEEATLSTMLAEGYTLEDISKKLPKRSVSAIRGKIERLVK
jgi:hypothetical protein